MSSQASQASQTTVSADQLSHCVRFIINKSCTKLPVKRADISKYMQSAFSDITPAHTSRVIQSASRVLSEVYGYYLHHLQSKSGLNYILILNEEFEDMLHPVSALSKNRALLMATLTHIFMNGAPVPEDDMWKFLERANLMKKDDHDTRKILTHGFTKELYLKYEKVGEADYARYVFKWGERASLELPQTYLLKKVTEAFDRPIDYWCEQHKSADVNDKEILKQLKRSSE